MGTQQQSLLTDKLEVGRLIQWLALKKNWVERHMYLMRQKE